MKYGEIVRGVIDRFDKKGRGIFDISLPDGRKKPMAVPFTTVGDEVEATHIKREQGRYFGRLEQILSPGPDRIPLPDPVFKDFSGAMWLHIDYDAQLRFKRDMINRAFEEAGHDERIDAVIPDDPRPADHGHFFYRNRMDYVFGHKGEIGLKAYGAWNKYIDVRKDILLSPDVPAILDVFRAFMKEHPILEPWDAKHHRGDVRYAVIREGKHTGQRLIALVVKDLNRISDGMREVLKEKLDGFATDILLSENSKMTDISYGVVQVPLKGDAIFEEEVNGTMYAIHVNSFFQTNTAMAAKLQDIVWDNVPARANRHPYTACRLLDLYCGLGFFAVNFARRDPELVVKGFEIDEASIELATDNAKQNGVGDRCEFFAEKSENLAWEDIDADTVIVDPPRAGLHPKVIQTLVDKKYPALIYVSCNYHRLTEELKKLKRAYRVDDVKALDLFPHTPHVEVVAKLTSRIET
ncbi:class I SAM-dependent RNA methyltransferase [candidate division WWE3 bacterium]|uniref:Class I SAM-dependent RNA methyltransferase n=1 Tax=candidate division WWE3 bacterium TaxID=2053526 RepID=A0A928TW97_UNCKA|nr:class I SAM-dependent RNA methyltransferase [candidate division WWE3 bacterium]